MAAGVVVEPEGCLTDDHAILGAVPPRPPEVRAVLAQLAAAEDALYAAARARDRGRLREAVQALPISVGAAALTSIVDTIYEDVT